jgi:hypothetical protein
MLTKLTSKNQITLPVELVRELPATKYFDATFVDGVVVLQPVRMVPLMELKELRRRLRRAGVRRSDLTEAVRWARGRK